MLCFTTQSFDRLYNLKVHMRKHTGETPYVCPMAGCALQFKWRSSMAHHVRAHHGGTAADVASGTTAARRRAARQRSNTPSSTATASAPISAEAAVAATAATVNLGPVTEEEMMAGTGTGQSGGGIDWFDGLCFLEGTDCAVNDIDNEKNCVMVVPPHEEMFRSVVGGTVAQQFEIDGIGGRV